MAAALYSLVNGYPTNLAGNLRGAQAFGFSIMGACTRLGNLSSQWASPELDNASFRLHTTPIILVRNRFDDRFTAYRNSRRDQFC